MSNEERTLDPAELRALVAAEFDGITSGPRADALRLLLIEPVLERRASGGAACDCWIIGRSERSGVLLAYCRGPFADPWGVVMPGTSDLGTSNDWHASLDQAFAFAGGKAPPSPDGFED